MTAAPDGDAAEAPIARRLLGSLRIAWTLRETMRLAAAGDAVVRRAQSRRAAAIVAHAAATVPYYCTRGDVVISNLVNRATVLLNYRLGDEASLVATRCGCGSPLPLLSFLEGRAEDWFPVPSGERIYTQRLRVVFTDERDLWQYQLVHESPAALRVALVAADGVDRAVLASRVGAAIARVVGPGVAIRVDFVRELERTVTGKARTIVRRDALDQPATPVA